MRRQHSEQIQSIQTIVKRVNSLMKLPKLSQIPNSLHNNPSPNQTKRTTSSPSQSNRTNYWKQKLLIAKKLVPLDIVDKNEQQSKSKPKSSLLLNKLVPSYVKVSQIEERVLSSKLYGSKPILTGIKNSLSTRNVHFYNNPVESTYKQADQYSQQKINKIKQNFKLLLTQEAYNELLFPNFPQVNLQTFFPFWEMVDTMLYTYQKLGKKTNILKEILTSYCNLSNQLNSIRKQIYSDIDKLGKTQLNEIILKAFIIQIQFIYMILAQMIWKQAIGVFQQFLKSKLQLIIKVRKQILRIYLCDFTTKQQIKVNKRIVGFVSFKQKYVNQLKKHIEIFQNDFNTLFIQFNDPKFAIFNCPKIEEFQQIIQFQRKLKNKVLDIPIEPYLKFHNFNDIKYNLIIQPQGFLFKQNKQTSTFLLRQGSLNFIKFMSENCNIIFFSKLSVKTLNQYVNYLGQNLRIKFDYVLDKKYMTYKNLRLQKNLNNLGFQNILSKTIVIDPYYKQCISKQFWKLCFPIYNQDNWQDSKFIDKLTQKLLNKIQSNLLNQ